METLSLLPSEAGADDRQAGKAAPVLRDAGRADALTAQKVEVAIILQAMLGTPAAAEYLENNAVDAAVAQRVLYRPKERRGRHDANGILC
jgi:hypothetical protein